jgi:hypothetical protein
MAKLTIGGTEVPQVLRAKVHITHGESRDPLLVPIIEIEVTVPLTESTLFADWAKAPKGPDRFKKVELQTMHREGGVAHTWTLLQAWVKNFEETEFAPELTSGGTGVEAQLTNYDVRVTIAGALLPNQDYNGVNIITVAAGAAQQLPG